MSMAAVIALNEFKLLMSIRDHNKIPVLNSLRAEISLLPVVASGGLKDSRGAALIYKIPHIGKIRSFR